jgi:serine protease AprX
VLTVGSIDHSDPWPGGLTESSSRGPSLLDPTPLYYFPEIMAPGENIRSSWPGGGYVSGYGTSMAGPHVTALVGLCWSANPELRGRVYETIDIITASAIPLSGQLGSRCGADYTSGPNNDWGYGTIDAWQTVQACQAAPPCVPVTGTVLAWQPLTPTVGIEVNFSGAATGTEPVFFSWAFGDGEAGQGQKAAHTYFLSGSYTVELTATNGCGVEVVADALSVIPACNPVADPSFSWAPIIPTVEHPITFTAVATGTEPISFTWAFGDGEVGSGAMVTHTYAASDTYTVVLSAANECGGQTIDQELTVVAEAGYYRIYLPIVVRGF